MWFTHVVYSCLQFPSSVRAFHQSLTVRYRQEYRWWSSVELARRLLLLLFIVVFPDNEVGYTLFASRTSLPSHDNRPIFLNIYVICGSHYHTIQ